MDCSESSLCLQPVPLLGVKAAACLAQPKKPWKSLWGRDTIWNLHCSLPRACLVGWTEERDHSPRPKAPSTQGNITKQRQNVPGLLKLMWYISLLCLLSFFSLFPLLSLKRWIKATELPSSRVIWEGIVRMGRVVNVPRWWEGKKRKILMSKSLKISQSFCRAQGELCLTQG